MYSVLGNRLIKNNSLVATLDKDEMIDYLLVELNEFYMDHQLCEEVRDDLEDALSEVDDLESEIIGLREELYDLEEKLEEYENNR